MMLLHCPTVVLNSTEAAVSKNLKLHLVTCRRGESVIFENTIWMQNVLKQKVVLNTKWSKGCWISEENCSSCKHLSLRIRLLNSHFCKIQDTLQLKVFDMSMCLLLSFLGPSTSQVRGNSHSRGFMMDNPDSQVLIWRREEIEKILCQLCHFCQHAVNNDALYSFTIIHTSLLNSSFLL